MIHVIVGDGRGKTSSAVGLAVRAAGQGLNVLFVQFLKDDRSGEMFILRTVQKVTLLHPNFNYGFTFQMTKKQFRDTAIEYERMMDIAINFPADLIVLDESLHALGAGLIERSKLEELLNKDCEIVLTGYNAPEWLTERADYISNVKKIKHPYDRGIQARRGIEF